MQPPSSDDVQLLTQVGFLAAGRGDVAAALRIFEALALLRPDRSFAFVGLTIALLNAGRASEAVQRLDTVHLPGGPESDMLEAFKGLALQFAERRGESTYVLRRVAGRARQAGASEGALLAARLLGEDRVAVSSPEPVLSI